MHHYICLGGCEGVSEKEGKCQDPKCPDYQKDLKHCDCTDGKHDGAFEEKKKKAAQ
ncbi:MAG: hypothetical protein G01um101419_754 [Parcubacteria group bacterium Gr01-1014_19]|nr:MAG: hypothetical protein G01um101419_754 [Parcubacteria group bacterium Gr01-1014_19]